VPDDFDNVQALHSPYGAVHGLGTPITSPVDFGTPSYAHDMMRPLMVDVRRAEGDDHMSPTGLSPAFGSIGFTPSGTMSNPDILSPLSPTSGDRYGYSSHMTAPLSAGPRTSHPYARTNSMDQSMQMNNRQQIRPLQPLHLREMTRSRSDNLHSPLRSSMSWKGDSIDYTYQGGNHSPQMAGRPQNVYQSDQMNNTSNNSMGYDSNSYSNNVQSPTAMNYPNLQTPSLQQAPQNRSRIRAASATLPLGLDLRNQYRSVGSTLQSPSHATTPRATTGSQYPGSGAYTASFPSAPLTAPIDYSMPRTPGAIRTNVQDYSMPQMSAPIAPPNDFSQAFHASMAGGSRTPMRDSFGGGPLGISGTQPEPRSDEYVDANGMKRKRSFGSIPGTAPSQANSSAPQPYGSTS
jgi:hypothetical protein